MDLCSSDPMVSKGQLYLKLWMFLILTWACLKPATRYAVNSQLNYPIWSLTFLCIRSRKGRCKFHLAIVPFLKDVLRTRLKHLGTTNWKITHWFLLVSDLLSAYMIKRDISTNSYFTFCISFWNFDLFSLASLFSYCCIILLEPKGDFLFFIICTVSNFIS